MDAGQRKTVALAAYAIALVLFVFFFGRQFWEWASWHDSKGTIDFGFLKISSRPEFPNDLRSVLLGLIAPIVLAAGGRLVGGSGSGRA
jgi:hypothetical protein